MVAYYSKYPKFHVAVDCIVFAVKDHKLSVLLVKRDFEPEKGKWSLIGGFTGEGESVDAAAQRVLQELTGLRKVYMQQVGAFGDIGRDPGERVVSVAYFALLNFDDVDHYAVEQHKAKWVELDKLPPLGFDHPRMIMQARAEMRRRISSEPLAFQLLPEMFTLTQVQTLVEAVTGETLDKRNFRKRICENACIVATDDIDKVLSRRGARLYRYLPDVYAGNRHFKI